MLAALDIAGVFLRDLDRARAEGGHQRQVRTSAVVPPDPGRRPARDPRHAAPVRALGPLLRSRGATRLHPHRRLAGPGHVDHPGVRAGAGRPRLVVLLLLVLHLLGQPVLRPRIRVGVPLGVRPRQRRRAARGRLPAPRGDRRQGRSDRRRRPRARWRLRPAARARSASSRSRRDPRTACATSARSTGSRTGSARSTRC